MQRQHLLSVLAILACTALAIVAHAALPAEVDEARLDGFLERVVTLDVSGIRSARALQATAATVRASCSTATMVNGPPLASDTTRSK